MLITMCECCGTISLITPAKIAEAIDAEMQDHYGIATVEDCTCYEEHLDDMEYFKQMELATIEAQRDYGHPASSSSIKLSGELPF